MGSQVSVSDFDRVGKRGLGRWYPGDMRFCRLRSLGTERATGSYAPSGKGQTSMRLFHQFRYLKKKPYWGNHFWAKGYCVDTVGLDADMIRKYVRYQEKKEKQLEQLQLID
jgi:hypothetical protein